MTDSLTMLNIAAIFTSFLTSVMTLRTLSHQERSIALLVANFVMILFITVMIKMGHQ